MKCVFCIIVFFCVMTLFFEQIGSSCSVLSGIGKIVYKVDHFAKREFWSLRPYSLAVGKKLNINTVLIPCSSQQKPKYLSILFC